jgi:hypothetical protein
MNMDEIMQKRAILLSARTRFAPEMQPVRETAIDKIVEQNLLLIDCVEGVALHEMEKNGVACFTGGRPIISRLDTANSIKRLVDSGRVVLLGEQSNKYRLSDQVLEELWETQKLAEGRLTRVTEKLFKNAGERFAIYSTPFLDCLCLVFSQLSESYVRLLKREIEPEKLLSQPNLQRALQEVAKAYSKIDYKIFESAVLTFFRDNDPDYDAIKWNMTQNYYVTQALGLDPSGRLLSSEIFGRATFYLDTNIVISALESTAQHHQSFRTLCEACNQLGVKLKVCRITLDELRRVVNDQRILIAKVVGQIPDNTFTKVRGIFFRLYGEKLKKTGVVDLDELFTSFDHPEEDLDENYEVELIDDVWFMDEEDSVNTEKLTEELRQAYFKKRGRTKGRGSALHDALLLQWILREREKNSENTWLLTLDTSLPSIVPKLQKETSMGFPAITLDALIQWISPMAMYGDMSEIAAIFSEAVKYQLLPQESFFDLKDFLMFAEMEWICKELPAEDVEECIRYLRVNAANLDPTNPIDREKLAREISKFFADPSRKYKGELHRLEIEIADKEDKHKLEVRERDKEIEELKSQMSEQERKSREEILRMSARSRAIAAGLFFVAIEAVAVYTAGRYGAGENFIKKIFDLWQIPVLAFSIGTIVFWLILGKKRIRALGWPFTKYIE